MPESTTPPLRGRRGRDRRIAEQVAEEFAARHALRRTADGTSEVDFDVAEVDAEVEDFEAAESAPRPSERARPPGPRLGPTPGRVAAIACRTSRPCRRSWSRPARSGRCSSDSVGRTRTVGGSAGTSGSSSVPHGAKSYLAAALAQARTGERLVWVARDAEIGDRVAEELGAWLGDPEAVAILEPRTALAYERSELVADETAARVAALAAWRSGRARVMVAGRPGPPPAHDRARRPAGRAAPAAVRRPAAPGRPAPGTARARLRPGDRGRGSRRVRPSRRHRRRVPAVVAAPDPGRVLRRRDRLAARLRPDRPAHRADRRRGGAPAGVRVPAAVRAASPRSASGWAGPPPASPNDWPPTSPGSRARRTTCDRRWPRARPGR